MSSKNRLSRLFRKAKLNDGSTGAAARADGLTPRDDQVGTISETIPIRPRSQDIPAGSTPLVGKSAASLSNPAERLWFQAYDGLRAEDPSLVGDFEALSRQLDLRLDSKTQNLPNHDGAARQEQLRQLIRTGLQRTEKEARLKQGLGDSLGAILMAKDIINSAIQAVPHAALAWSGVCLILEVRA